jgi:hypothetical protein
MFGSGDIAARKRLQLHEDCQYCQWGDYPIRGKLLSSY